MELVFAHTFNNRTGIKIIGFGLKYISKQIEQIFENYVAKIEQIYI